MSTPTVSVTPSPCPTRRRLVRAALVAGGVVLAAVVSAEVAVRLAPFPEALLNQFEYSPEWLSADGEPLGFALTARGDYALKREAGDLSPWLEKATLAIEDRRFRSHSGIDWARVGRATFDNVIQGRRVSGASTVSMQVCRLCDPADRTWSAKITEAWRAVRLERRLSKDEILSLYLNRAPYGGNCVGVEAAAQRYFGKGAKSLTLAEAALICGLPQSPESLRPDRHPERALARRARVLDAMLDCGCITADQHAQASREPIPKRVAAEPAIAPHLVTKAARLRPHGAQLRVRATLQREVVRVLEDRMAAEPNALQGAVVVIDLATGDEVAHIGASRAHVAPLVDHSTRQRSPGSTLKSFVYALAFEDRRIAPDTTLADAGLDDFTWAPRNFDRRVRGDVPVEDALRESLNLPALALTREVGLRRSLATAAACGVRFDEAAAERAGLSWAVGGAEITLADLTAAYATLGRGGLSRPVRRFSDEPLETPARRVLSERACRALDQCLGVSDAHLPRGWENLSNAHRPWFMWKTGTGSSGSDAWAVGHNGRYAIGVWVGPSRGVTGPRVLSRTHAEPLLASLFSLPSLLVETAPAFPSEWWEVVRAPRDTRSSRILAPADGARLIATSGTVAVFPKTTLSGRVQWFLDGAPVSESSLRPLRLAVGAHELRVVAPEGDYSAVTVTVEPAP